MSFSPDASCSVAAELQWLKGLARALAPGDAEDLVQDTWISASRAQPDPDRPLRPWLGRVLRNHARMRWRSRTRRVLREQLVEAPPQVTDAPEDMLAKAEAFAVVAELVAKLEPSDRAMLIARYCDDLCATEIGMRLGIAASTVRSRLHRTLKRLRAQLDTRYGGNRPAWAVVLTTPGSSLTNTVSVWKGVSMGIALKLGLSAAVAAPVALWLFTERSPQAREHQAVTVAPTPGPGANGRSARRDWEHRVQVLRLARARRLAARDPTSAAEPAQRGPASPDGREGEAYLGDLAAELDRSLSDAVSACQEANPSGQGFVELRVSILGEPELGAVVEHVEVTDTDMDSAALQECLQESLYTLDFDSPPVGVDDQTTVSLHVGHGMIAVDSGKRRDELAVEGGKPGFSLQQRVLATSGGIDESDAESIAREHSMVIIHCFLSLADDREVADYPFGTDVRADIELGNEGAAHSVAVTVASDEPETDVETLRACVAGAISRWRFGAGTAAGGRVTYAFAITPS